MSIEAISWVIKQDIPDGVAKLVAMVLADYADRHTGEAHPKIRQIAEACSQPAPGCGADRAERRAGAGVRRRGEPGLERLDGLSPAPGRGPMPDDIEAGARQPGLVVSERASAVGRRGAGRVRRTGQDPKRQPPTKKSVICVRIRLTFGHI